MKKYLTLFSFILMALACNKSDELVKDEIALGDAITLTESATALSETTLTQTTSATQSMGTEGAKWTKEQIRTFINNWLALSKEEKMKKFPTLTKMEKKILFIFMSNHKKKATG
jgi:aspartyl-tRNA synthetase